MKNHRELLGVIANVLLVIIVLLIIVIGLNKIGVYSLPLWAEKIIGTYGNEITNSSEDDIKIYNSLKEKSEDKSLNSIELTFENAEKILNELEPLKNYSQEFVIENIYGNSVRREKVSVVSKNGMYSATVSNNNGFVLRRLEEDENYVNIIDYHEGIAFESKQNKGEFSIYEECGFILDVENFLNSGFELSDAAFATRNDEKLGTLMSISFVSQMGDFSQTEQYTVSLDYGVVISAYCYQGDNMIYSMITTDIGGAA